MKNLTKLWGVIAIAMVIGFSLAGCGDSSNGDPTSPGTNNPGTNNPGTNNPGTNNPGTNNPGTNNPGTNNPGTDNPGTDNPGTDNPGTGDPSGGDETTVPNDPANVEGTALSYASIQITWNAAPHATSYKVLYTSDYGEDPNYEEETVTGVSFTLNGLTPDTTYYFRVKAVNAAGESFGYLSGGMARTLPPPKPDAPTNVTAVVGTDKSITISWDAVQYATRYQVYFSEGSSSSWNQASDNNNPLQTTSYTHTGLEDGTSYTYHVKAANQAGEGPASADVSATLRPPAPNLTVTAQTGASIRLSWTAAKGATGYKVEYQTGSSEWTPIQETITATSYTHSGLTEGTTYTYHVKALGSAGESDYSPNKSATVSSSSGGGNTGGNTGGGTTTEYRLDQPLFNNGRGSKNGNNLTIGWSIATSGETPNGLYTYTSPSNIIIQVYNGSSFDNIQTLASNARTFTLNSFAVYQYSPEGTSGNRVTIRVYCTSGSSSYNSQYATISYYVEQDYWVPIY
jgi:cellulose 1,4-beta-cellobiosidase